MSAHTGAMEEYIECQCGKKIKYSGFGRRPKQCRECRLGKEADIRDRTRARGERAPYHNMGGNNGKVH